MVNLYITAVSKSLSMLMMHASHFRQFRGFRNIDLEKTLPYNSAKQNHLLAKLLGN